MLLGNFSYRNANPGREVGNQYLNKFAWRKGGSCMQFYTGDHVVTDETEKSSFPNGHVPPSSFILAPVGGGISSINEMEGVGTITSNQSNGINILADLEGDGTISAASLSMIVQAAADLAGSGVLSASMVGVVNMAAGLAGSGDVVAALNTIAFCIASLTGNGTIAATLRGTLTLEADIYVNQSTATTEEIAAAVWNALCASFVLDGSFGKLVQDTEKKVDDNQALIVSLGG